MNVYVAPRALYGTELAICNATRMRELDAAQRTIGRWLLHSRQAPNAVVQGDLGWTPWSHAAAERPDALLARLTCCPEERPAASVLRVAAAAAGTWAHFVFALLRQWGVPWPCEVGLNPSSPPAARVQYRRFEVMPRLVLTSPLGLAAPGSPRARLAG